MIISFGLASGRWYMGVWKRMNVYGRSIGTLITAVFILFSAACFAEEQVQSATNDLVQKGEREAGKGNWEAAASQFYKAVSEDEKNPIAFYDLGVAYLHLGDLSKAKMAEEQALSLNPEFENAYIQLATILSKSGDSSGAENALRKLLDLKPDNQTAQANLKALLEERKKKDSRTNDTPPDSSEPVKMQVAPLSAGNNAAAGGASQGPGTTTLKADAILARAVQCQKSLKPEVRAVLEEAVSACQNNQLEAAKRLLTQVIEEDPSISCVYASLGAIVGTQGDYDAEIAKEKIAIELDEHNAFAHCNLAWALAHKNRWKEALSENERALALEPQFTEAAVGKALAQNELGFKNEAAETLRDLIARNGSELLPRVAMSALLDREGASEAGQAELAKALESNPDSQTLKQWQALIELKKGNWAGAQDFYGQIVKVNPQDAQAWLGLGLSLTKLGDQSKAVEALEKAVRLSPDSAAAHMALGLALEKKGNSADAEHQLNEAFRLNPGFRLAEADSQKRKSNIK
jgi:tetratricopeptide (TPR) repeat protein